MPVSSSIISADTVQVRPVGEAFLQGSFLMSGQPAVPDGTLLPAWGSYEVNMILVSLAVLVFIFQIRRIFRISPYLLEGIFRSKKLIDLEDGMRLIRDRNSLVPNSLLVMALISSAYGLYLPSFMEGYGGGARTLATYGAFCLFLLFRHLMVIGMSRYRLEGETYQMNNRIANDFLILTALFSLTVCGVLSLFHCSPGTVRTVLYYLLAVCYAVFVLRRIEILSGSCSQLPAILYLCILEILPAGLLVASAILF